MSFLISLLTTLQFLFLGSFIGKIGGNLILMYARSNPSGLASWYSGVYESGLYSFALIGICAALKGIFRFIEDRI